MGDNGYIEANTSTRYLVVVVTKLVIVLVAVLVAVPSAIVVEVLVPSTFTGNATQCCPFGHS